MIKNIVKNFVNEAKEGTYNCDPEFAFVSYAEILDSLDFETKAECICLVDELDAEVHLDEIIKQLQKETLSAIHTAIPSEHLERNRVHQAIIEYDSEDLVIDTGEGDTHIEVDEYRDWIMDNKKRLANFYWRVNKKIRNMSNYF